MGKWRGYWRDYFRPASVFSLKQESRSQLESDARDGVVGGLRIGRVNGLVKWDWQAVEACPLGVKAQKGIDVLLGCTQK